MTTEFFISDDIGRPISATLEQDGRGVVLHSRSGKNRNRDYRQAMETMLIRLDAASIDYDVYLDSRPVQTQPLERRRLEVARTGPVGDRFNAFVRAMNAGSSSNGAWRRLLFVAPNVGADQLVAIIRSQQSNGRLPAADLRAVTHAHIDRAVQLLLAGQDASNFAPSRDFDVLTPDGARLAPKKVFGLAISLATGLDAGPEHFTAGLGTPCFKALEAAGYPVVRKGEVFLGEAVDPDFAAAEGNQKLIVHIRRERKPALAAAKRRAMMEEKGHLECERCGIVPSAALGPHGDAVIEVHHAGTQIAEMGEGHVTRLADLACLCANCHRIVHRELAS